MNLGLLTGRQFRVAFGQTPYEYLMTRRIERAKALLRRDIRGDPGVRAEVLREPMDQPYWV